MLYYYTPVSNYNKADHNNYIKPNSPSSERVEMAENIVKQRENVL